MIATLGQLSLTLSLIVAFSCVVLGVVAHYRNDQKILGWLPTLFHLLTALVISSSFLLVMALLRSDFSLRYVWMYTNRTLEPIYKFTAFWGGQEGSMLFWCLIMALASSWAVLWMQAKRRQEPYDGTAGRAPWMVIVFAFIIWFFHLVMFFAENPFAVISNPPSDGRGLNPLLQTWSMIIHPPCLYIGFILCSVPFAISVATLMNTMNRGNLDGKWIRETRIWTIAAWFFLSAGNLLGANWAYTELGWGGFWAWDPVENAAIMPWFTTTAYLHSLMVQERRGLLKTWNFVLVSISFCLTILGTFITRSGLISSVHTFAKSNLGFFFLAFLIVCIVFCVALTLRYRQQLRSEGEINSWLSREAAFVMNNILLTIAAFAILWGTLFPIFSEAFTGKKITVGPPFFNSFMVPIGLAILLLMGFAQIIAWRKTASNRLVKLFFWPVAGLLLTLVTTVVIERDFSLHGLYVMLAFGLSMFVFLSIVQEFWRGISSRHRSHGESYFIALINLVLAARRRYGGYVVHFGVLLVFLGITGAAFKSEKEVSLAPDESIDIAGYQATYKKLRTTADVHKEAVYATVAVSKNGKTVLLEPARFFYRAANEKMGNSGEPQTSTEVDIHSTLFADFYTVLHTFNLDTKRATFMFVVNPLVYWLWIGGFVMILGTVIILLPRRFNVTEGDAIKKESMLQSIRELDFDHATGKMPTADFNEIKEQLLDNVVTYDHSLKNRQHIIAAELKGINITDAEAKALCKNCSLPYLTNDRFCTNCGSKLASLALFVLLFIGALFNYPAMAETGNGIIQGRLLLRGDKPKPLARQPVMLNFIHEATIKSSARLLTDERGLFRFTQLMTTNDWQYQLTSIHEEATFSSEPLGFVTGQKMLKHDLSVYPTTNDLKVLTAELLHIGLYADTSDNNIQFEETLLIKNLGKQAYFNKDGLAINLPDDAVQASMQEKSAELSADGKSMVIRQPLLPGATQQFVVHFTMQHQLGRLPFKQELPFPIQRLGVLLFPATMELRGNLKLFGNRQINGNDYRIYIREEAAAPSSALRFTVKSIPGGFGIVEIGVLAAMLVIFVSALLFIRRNPEQPQQLILKKLKILEHAHDNGTIEESQYQQYRQVLSNQLLAMQRK